MGEERGRADGHSVHLRWSGTIIGQQQCDLYLEAPSSPVFLLSLHVCLSLKMLPWISGGSPAKLCHSD